VGGGGRNAHSTAWIHFPQSSISYQQQQMKNGFFEKKTSEPGEKGTAFLDGNNSSPQQNQQDPKLTKSSGQS